jgi:alpha-glucosidase
MATRWAGGDLEKHKAALFLLLTLPGTAILYQGDEIGLTDGRVHEVLDLADPPRDPERTPMPWTPTGGEWKSPWLPLEDTSRNVETSPLVAYTRDLISMRKQFTDDSYETLPSANGVWAFRRGAITCRLNMTARRNDGLDPWEGVIS